MVHLPLWDEHDSLIPVRHMSHTRIMVCSTSTLSGPYLKWPRSRTLAWTGIDSGGASLDRGT